MRTAFVTLALAAATLAHAEDGARWEVHGSLTASGEVHSSDDPSAIPADTLIAPAPTSTFAGVLELGRDGERGGAKATLLGVAWDPADADDRGAYGGARLRLFRDLSPRWRATATDDARVQRHAGDAASDFERNELGLALERRLDGGGELGLHLVDRRRSAQAAADFGFARDSAAVALTLPSGLTRRVRLEAGVEHYDARATSGQRVFAAAALAHVGVRGTVSVRVEAYSSRLERTSSAAAALATPVPTVGPSSTPEVPVRSEADEGGRYLPSEIEPDGPGAASAYAGPELAVDALLVQPFEEDDDWDFGRSRLGLQVSASRALGAGWQASAYLHAQHRGGGSSEDRLWLRAALRRRLAARWTALLQGAHLTSRVSGTGRDFSRTQVGLGLQFTF